MSGKNLFRAVCAAGGVLLVAGSVAPGAAAVVSAEDTGDVQATVRKTVRQTGTATGEIESSSMYTQVSAVGSGTQTVTVPVGVDSNRNLNSFGAFPMEGESIVFELNVDGNVEERTLTDAESYPMKIAVRVTLDGQEIAPADVVGKSGVLDVEYTVTNTTKTTKQITFTDAAGKEVTEDYETATPFAGSLDITLPQGFNEVTAPGATVAGDARNGTQLGYTMVLFPPLGATEVKVGYQSRVADAVFPPAEFAFLPIIPFENSTIKGAVESYKGGAEVGSTIYGAGTGIGENLLKLQDGAGQLVAGLGQLSAGANQLSDGLQTTVAPGATALAENLNRVSDGLSQLNSKAPALEDGVSRLNDGVQTLNSGAQQIADGNASLADGLNQINSKGPALATGVSTLNGGAQTLAAGAKSLSDGLQTLSIAVDALPATIAEQLKTNPDYQRLLGLLGKLIAGIGVPTDTSSGTLLGGLNQVIGGLRYPGGYASTDCAVGLTGGDPVKCGVADANQFIGETLNSKAPVLDVLAGGVASLKCDPADPTCLPTQAALVACINGPTCALTGDPSVKAQTQAAAAALLKVAGKVDTLLIPGVKGIQKLLYNTPCNPNQTNPAASDFCGYAQALSLVKDGIPALVSALTASIEQTLIAGIGTAPPAAGCDLTKTLTCGAAAVAKGASDLAAGTTSLNSQVPALTSAISQLAAGATTLKGGSANLAGGTETLADGTEQLDEQVPALAAGVETLADGASQLAAGADRLAAGVNDRLAPGVETLAAGLGQAESSAPQIEDGAGQIKEQGADELAKAGSEAQIGFARSVAQLEAANQMGLEGIGIPFGPAEGSNVVTSGAYKIELAGIAPDTENNALKFGLGAALIAGAAGAAYAGMRRRAVA